MRTPFTVGWAKYSRPTHSTETALLATVGREYLAHPMILSRLLRVRTHVLRHSASSAQGRRASEREASRTWTSCHRPKSVNRSGYEAPPRNPLDTRLRLENRPAEPAMQCVPRQSLGTRVCQIFTVGRLFPCLLLGIANACSNPDRVFNVVTVERVRLVGGVAVRTLVVRLQSHAASRGTPLSSQAMLFPFG